MIHQSTSRGDSVGSLNFIPKGGSISILGYMLNDDLSWNHHVKNTLGDSMEVLTN